MSDGLRILRPDLHEPLFERGPAPVEPPPPVPPIPAEPTAGELAATFGAAMVRWAGAGFPVVDEATYRAREAACQACELWDGSARLGLGRCRAPGCGCTKFKRWLASERCLHPTGGRWPA